jgi:hypothetical protein
MIGIKYNNKFSVEELLTEEWKDICYWEGYYQCSNLGRIKSLKRTIIRKDGKIKILKERILKPYQNKLRYFHVVLCKNGKKKTYDIHQLVCTSFHGACPDGEECLHKDNNPANNHADNLCWGTRTENQHDRIANGTDNRGKKNNWHKLNWTQINKIRKMYATGEYTQKKLSVVFCITTQQINCIVNYKTWKI